MIRLVLLTLLLASRAGATVLGMEAFDDRTNAGTDIFGLTKTGTCAAPASGVLRRNATVGGTDTSNAGLNVNCGSGASGYYSLPNLLTATSTLSVAFSFHPLALPHDFNRTIVALRESDGAGGEQPGAFLQEHSAPFGVSDFVVTYCDSHDAPCTNLTTVGETSGSLFNANARACCDSKGANCSFSALCTTDADCPGGQCGTNLCTVAASNPGAYCATNADCGGLTCFKAICDDGGDPNSLLTTMRGCYFAQARLVETRFSSALVQVDFWLDQKHAIVGSPISLSDPGDTAARGLVNFRFGSVDTAASAFQYIGDDLTWGDSTSEGDGYVMFAVPNKDDFAANWTPSGCGGCSTNIVAGHCHWQCLDDWNAAGVITDGTDWVTSGASAGKPEFHSQVRGGNSNSFQARTGETVDGVLTLFGGSTSAADANRTLVTTLRLCTAPGACIDTNAPYNPTSNSMTLSTASHNTSDFLWGVFTWSKMPSAGGLAPWTNAGLTDAAWTLQTVTPNTGSSRLQAVGMMAHVSFPPTPVSPNLKDQNGDGVIACYNVGDSTDGDTLAGQCPTTNVPCSVDNYCSSTLYSSEYPFNDHPPGGCTTDAQCQTCTGRRSETGSGLGYACDVDNTCGDNAATCTGGSGTCCLGNAAACTGTCSQNLNTPCGCASDCNVANLGSCDSSATCKASCPAGTHCPQHISWGNYAQGRLGCDQIIRCGKGGETTAQLVQNRLATLLAGTDSSCVADQGSGHCSVTTTTVCTATADCPNGEVCVFSPPDNLALMEGYNNAAWAVHSPSCKGSFGVGDRNSSGHGITQSGRECGGCAATKCWADSDCTAVNGSDAQCFGLWQTNPSNANDSCVVPEAGVAPSCNISTTRCNSNADCATGAAAGLWGGTCSVNTPSVGPLQGVCQCAVNGDCVAGTSCVGSLCRLNCSSDADCGGLSGSCRAGSPRVCAGGCTCPSTSKSCTTDADCEGAVIGGSPQYHGKCVASKCTCTGVDSCSQDTECTGTNSLGEDVGYMNSYRFIRSHVGAVSDYGTVASTMAANSGHPTFIALTIPRPNANECFDRYGFPNVHWDGVSIYDNESVHLKETFPYVADARASMTTLKASVTHADTVHLNAFGEQYTGQPFVTLLQALDSCASGKCVASYDSIGASCQNAADCGKHCSRTHTTSCTGDPNCLAGETCVSDLCTMSWLATPQKYCRAFNHTWTTTLCTDGSQCSGTQSCELPHVGCDCRSDAECLDWFGKNSAGSSPTCQNKVGGVGQCKNGATDSCTAFGGTYTCDRPTDLCKKPCTVDSDCGGGTGACNNLQCDACPGSGDTAYPESGRVRDLDGNGAVRVVALGDSNTHQFTATYDWPNGIGNLQSMVDRYGWQVINEGWPGTAFGGPDANCTGVPPVFGRPGCSEYYVNQALTNGDAPDVAILAFGTNNILGEDPNTTMAAAALIDYNTLTNAGVLTYVALIPPLFSPVNANYIANVAGANAAIRAVIPARNIIDFNTIGAVGDYDTDGVHILASGQTKRARAVFNTLTSQGR